MSPEDSTASQIVVVPTLVSKALELVKTLHIDLGHLGINATTESLRTHAWFPYSTEMVEYTVRTCNHCQFAKRNNIPPQPMFPLPRVHTGDVWSFDFVGPLPKTKRRNQYLLTSMDMGTDYTFAEVLIAHSANAVISLLRHLILLFGKPRAVLTDNGEEFMSYAFQNLLQRLTIEHLHTSPYHPQTNGCLEKFNDTLVQILARFCAPDKQTEWDEYVPDALLAHRAHKNPSTGNSPGMMMFGFEPRLPGDTVYDTLRIPPSDIEISVLQERRLEHIKNLEQYREEANAKALERLEVEAAKREDEYKERGLGIGDLVLRKSERQSKIHPRWDGPFIIQDVSGKNTYQLMTRNGYILRHLYNGAQLRPYYSKVPSQLPDPSLWYASADLQRRDAHERMKTGRSAGNSKK